MKIGVFGTGDVGKVLASGLTALGHQVMMGSRDPHSERVRAWVIKAGTNASAGTNEQAAAFGDLIVLATLWSGTKSAIDLAGGAKAFAGKTVLDVTNPLVFGESGPPTLALGHTDSGGEQVQRWLTDSHVVKCFNIVGNAHMVHPDFPGGPPDMFMCGNDDDAKKTIAEICTAWGWPVTDLGGIEGARLLEPLCILWVAYGARTASWNHALKMLRK